MIDVAKVRVEWDRKNYELDMHRRAEGIAREAVALALEDAAREADEIENKTDIDLTINKARAGWCRALAARYRQEPKETKA